MLRPSSTTSARPSNRFVIVTGVSCGVAAPGEKTHRTTASTPPNADDVRRLPRHITGRAAGRRFLELIEHVHCLHGDREADAIGHAMRSPSTWEDLPRVMPPLSVQRRRTRQALARRACWVRPWPGRLGWLWPWRA